MNSRWVKTTGAIAVALIVALAVAAGCAESKDADKPAKPATKKLPKLLELGSVKCMPCKMMKPVLEELQKEYKGQLEIVFIDVNKDSAAVSKYKVRSIPTQVFFDAKGKEIFRHVGFFPKKDILKAFADHGIKLKAPEKPKK